MIESTLSCCSCLTSASKQLACLNDSSLFLFGRVFVPYKKFHVLLRETVLERSKTYEVQIQRTLAHTAGTGGQSPGIWSTLTRTLFTGQFFGLVSIGVVYLLSDSELFDFRTSTYRGVLNFPTLGRLKNRWKINLPANNGYNCNHYHINRVITL